MRDSSFALVRVKSTSANHSVVNDVGWNKATGDGQSGKPLSRNRVSYPQTKLSPRRAV
jgi:hypothetical protein